MGRDFGVGLNRPDCTRETGEPADLPSILVEFPESAERGYS
jgi:hypothetical protein